jgi:hypothetical protein
MIEDRETHSDMKGYKIFRTDNKSFSDMVHNL